MRNCETAYHQFEIEIIKNTRGWNKSLRPVQNLRIQDISLNEKPKQKKIQNSNSTMVKRTQPNVG